MRVRSEGARAVAAAIAAAAAAVTVGLVGHGVRGQSEADTPVTVYPGVTFSMGDNDEAAAYAAALNGQRSITVRAATGGDTPAPTLAGGVCFGLRGAANYGTQTSGLNNAHTGSPRFDGRMMTDRDNLAGNDALFTGTGQANGDVLYRRANRRDPFTCGLGASWTRGATTDQLQRYTGISAPTGVAAYNDAALSQPSGLYLEAGNAGPGTWTTRNYRVVANDQRSSDRMAFLAMTANYVDYVARQIYWAADLNDAPTIDAMTHSLPDISIGATSQEITVSALLAAVTYNDDDSDMGYCVYSGIVIDDWTSEAGSQWFYRNSASTWQLIGAVNGFNAWHLPAESALRLDASGGGAGTNVLRFRAWDSTTRGFAGPALSETTYAYVNTVGKLGGEFAGSLNQANLSVTVLPPTTGVATTGVPTTGVPTTGVPTTGVPTTGVPTTGVPTTGVPTTGVATTGAAPPPTTGVVTTTGTTGTTNVPSSTGTTGVSTGTTNAVVATTTGAATSPPPSSPSGGSGTPSSPPPPPPPGSVDATTSDEEPTIAGLPSVLFIVIIAIAACLCIICVVAAIFFVAKKRKGSDEKKDDPKQWESSSTAEESGTAEDSSAPEVVVYDKISGIAAALAENGSSSEEDWSDDSQPEAQYASLGMFREQDDDGEGEESADEDDEEDDEEGGVQYADLGQFREDGGSSSSEYESG